MLKNLDLSIKEISLRLNFPDQSSFGRFFKSITGQSPKAFREGLTGR
jgi:AraC-like DNA-binding protein